MTQAQQENLQVGGYHQERLDDVSQRLSRMEGEHRSQATKEDIANVRTEIAQVETKIANVETTIAGVRTEIQKSHNIFTWKILTFAVGVAVASAGIANVVVNLLSP